jgi:hypothetical protein
VAAVANRHRDDASFLDHELGALERGLGYKRSESIFPIHAQHGIGCPDEVGRGVDANQSFPDSSREYRQSLHAMRVMSAQIRFDKEIRLNRALAFAGTQPRKNVEDHGAFVFGRNNDGSFLGKGHEISTV